jgi:PAS domain S-box-containing protein
MVDISKIREKIMKALKVWRLSMANLNDSTKDRSHIKEKCERLFELTPLRAGEALRESEEKFFKAFHFSPDIIAITTLKNGVFIEVNDSFTRITGYTREEVINHSSGELGIWAKEEDRTRMLKMLKGKGRVYNEEFEFRVKSGEIRIWLFSAEPINIGDEPCLISMTTDITERRQAEERLEHLNSVLLAIRNVNQLIAKEKDRDRLLKGACDELIETRGYYNVWISLLDDSEGFITAVESGLGKDFLPLVERFERGELNYCARTALKQSGVVMTEDPSTNCSDCPLAKMHRGKGVLTVRLEYDRKAYGLLTASVPIAFIQAKEEQALFKEVANDLAFALHDIGLAEGRKRAEEALRESEEKFSKAFRSSPDAIAITTLKDGRFIEVNDSYTRITGFTRKEVIGHSTTEFGVWAKAEERARILRMLKEQGRVSNEEVHLYMKSGEISTGLFSAELINIGGEPCMISVATDITELKHVEEALRESEEFTSSLLENAPNPIVSINPDTSIRYVNAAFEKLTGFTLAEIAGRKIPHPWWPEEKEEEISASIKETLAIGSRRLERMFQKKNGELFWVDMNMVPIICNETLKYYLANWVDITEHKKAEEKLQESEEKYRDLLDNTSELIQSVTPDGRFRYVNNGWRQALGYSDNEISNLRVSDIIHPDCLEHYNMVFQNIRPGGDIGRINTTFVSKNGSKIIVEGNVTGRYVNGELVYTRGIFRDITRSKYLEEQMFRLSSAVSMATDCIVITDFDAKIIDVNQKTLEMYGADSKEELIGRHFLELIVPAERLKVNIDVSEIIEKGSLECRQYNIVSKQGREFPVQMSTSLVRDADGKPMGMVRVGRELISSISLMQGGGKQDSGISMRK